MIGYLDVTYLENDPANLAKLIQAVQACDTKPAGFCVYAKDLLAAQALSDTPLVTVANFPKGDSAICAIFEEIKTAQELQAHEIDVVIPYQSYLQTRNDKMLVEFIEEIRSAQRGTLKFIIETGAFTDMRDVFHISKLLCLHGADFVKTSTGKISLGATPAAVQVICEALKQHYDQTKKRVGIKISGGVRTKDQFKAYFDQVQENLGQAWLNKDLFRVGASQLFWELV